MQDKYEKTKRVDAQGRVLIPASIREALDLQEETEVSVKLDGDTIKINVAEMRCCICHERVNGNSLHVYGGRGKSEKLVCESCEKKIKEA